MDCAVKQRAPGFVMADPWDSVPVVVALDYFEARPKPSHSLSPSSSPVWRSTLVSTDERNNHLFFFVQQDASKWLV